MKKVLLYTIAIIASLSLFTSCSDEDILTDESTPLNPAFDEVFMKPKKIVPRTPPRPTI